MSEQRLASGTSKIGLKQAGGQSAGLAPWTCRVSPRYRDPSLGTLDQTDCRGHGTYAGLLLNSSSSSAQQRTADSGQRPADCGPGSSHSTTARPYRGKWRGEPTGPPAAQQCSSPATQQRPLRLPQTTCLQQMVLHIPSLSGIHALNLMQYFFFLFPSLALSHPTKIPGNQPNIIRKNSNPILFFFPLVPIGPERGAARECPKRTPEPKAAHLPQTGLQVATLTRTCLPPVSTVTTHSPSSVVRSPLLITSHSHGAESRERE